METKLQFRRSLVWHPARLVAKSKKKKKKAGKAGKEGLAVNIGKAWHEGMCLLQLEIQIAAASYIMTPPQQRDTQEASLLVKEAAAGVN